MKNKMITLFAPLIILPFLVSCSSSTDENTSSIESEKSYSHSSIELALLDEVNAYRVSVGLNPLNIIEHISYKSNEHNEYMISIHDANHDGFNERRINLQQVLGAARVGENVAYGYATPQSVVNAWVNSPSHKANIEGNYSHFGTAIKADENGKKYYTNIFIKK